MGIGTLGGRVGLLDCKLTDLLPVIDPVLNYLLYWDS